VSKPRTPPAKHAGGRPKLPDAERRVVVSVRLLPVDVDALDEFVRRDTSPGYRSSRGLIIEFLIRKASE